MLYALSFFLYELTYRAVGSRGFEKFDFRLSNLEESRAYFLFGYFFYGVAFEPQLKMVNKMIYTVLIQFRFFQMQISGLIVYKLRYLR